MNLFEALAELVLAFWRADGEFRDSSLVGESEMDRGSRRIVGCLCGGALTVLAALGFVYWYLTR